jgi:hypothetical protein
MGHVLRTKELFDLLEHVLSNLFRHMFFIVSNLNIVPHPSV